MSKPFDIELFLAGVLTGSHATRRRHLHQESQSAGSGRPLAWQRKHVVWFLDHRLSSNSDATRYYCFLTARLISLRLKKS
uniref:Uncharacterized protein n=1 Tax=Pseudomonas graminis TaxID=158627 RepID=A0A7C2B0D3_9PSED